MKGRKIVFLVGIIISLNQLSYCTADKNTLKENSAEKLSYIGTKYGGCNGQVNFEKRVFKLNSENDTVFYAIHDDTLKISIGQNYICCAPFEVTSAQENNNLNITLKDTCSDPYISCYCRCNCYYEFEVDYLNYQGEPIHLYVYLHDPRQSADSLIHQLEIGR